MQSIISAQKAPRPRSSIKESVDAKHQHAIRPYVSKERRPKRDSRDRQLSSIEMVRSKSKRLDSCKKSEDCATTQLAAECKMLKHCYNQLLHTKQSNQKHLQAQIVKAGQEAEQYRKHISIMQKEIERLKRECYKLLDTERFKNKKLQETIQQKELMIAYLRNEVDCMKKSKNKSNCNESALHFLQNSAPIFPNVGGGTQAQHKHQQNSLSFSRDRSNDYESLHTLLSNNEQEETNVFVRKDIVMVSSGSEESKVKMRKITKKGQSQGVKKNKLTARKLQIHTDENNINNSNNKTKERKEDNSIEIKKKLSTNRIRKMSKKKKK